MFGVEKKVASAARKAALFSASAALASVGAAFLTVAAWIVLTELKSTLFAATIIGVVYFGFAIIGVAIAMSKPQLSRPALEDDSQLGGLSPMQLMVVSFLQGLEQGAQTKRASKH